MAQIVDEWLSTARRVSPGLEALLACVLAVLILLVPPQPGPLVTAPPEVTHLDGADGLTRWLDAAETGREVRHLSLERPDEEAWLIWENAPLDRNGPPPAVLLSGPFSGSLVVNGTHVGDKGVPGPDPASERAGPIETVIAIPPSLIRDSENWIALRVSSHHAGYRPHSVVQGFFIVPYNPDARRPIRYYLPLLLAGSALVALVTAIALRTRKTGDRRGVWLMIALCGLLLAGLAEVSRSQFNYPYSWHQPRQAVSLLGLAVFGLGFLRFIQSRWPAPPVHVRTVLALGAGAAMIAALLLTGYDAKSAAVTAILTAMAGVWLIWRGDAAARLLGLAVLIIPGYAFFLPGDIIDRGIYSCALAILALPIIRAPDFLLPEPARTRQRLALQMTGRALYLDLEEISHFKAAGNYTEVHTRSGGNFLDNRSLGQLLATLPESEFFRLHRSHAVRLDAATALTLAEGSRYRLELQSGERLPVSRSQVGTLRERLAGQKA